MELTGDNESEVFQFSPFTFNFSFSLSVVRLSPQLKLRLLAERLSIVLFAART